MTKQKLVDNWGTFALALALMAVYCWKLFVLLYAYFESSGFSTPPAPAWVRDLVQNPGLGLGLESALGSIIIAVLMVFSVSVSRGRWTVKSATMCIVCVGLIGAALLGDSLYASSRVVKGFELLAWDKIPGWSAGIYTKYFASLMESLLTFLLAVAGLSQLKVTQEGG